VRNTLVLLSSLALAACGSVKVDAGQEAVLIKQPMIFGSGGVDPQPVRTGRTFVAWTTKAVLVETRPIQASVEFQDLMSSEGIPLDFDTAVSFRVTDSVRLIRDFGQDWYANNLEAEFRNKVRQAVRKRGMNETAINTTAIEAIDNEVTDGMRQYIRQRNLPIQLIRITVGRANPPDSIKSQRISTATQQQRLQTEQQRQSAEQARLGAEQARAAADNAYRAQMQLSPEQFVDLERIKMMRDVCTRGKGCTFIQGGGTPLIQTR
jgi:regulator of protease activity HflC (stomatin/prohibitin superfamily)